LRTVKVSVVGLAAAAALTFSATSLAAPMTTAPTKTVLVQVLITDQRMIVAQYQGERLGNGQPGFAVFPGSIPRGDYLKFVVQNRGKKVHNFTIFGKTTKPIKPGGMAHFNKLAKIRGKFPYRSTFDKGKAFRGTIVIA
jgi:hypothetical protein